MCSPSGSIITYCQTDVQSILQLRHQVLRQGQPISNARFPEDQDPRSQHYGAFDEAGKALACLSLLPSHWQAEAAWRLRAMATAAAWRNQGIGTELVRFTIASLTQPHQLIPIWCHARIRAKCFYERLGWRAVSDIFEDGRAGPSIVMVRECDPMLMCLKNVEHCSGHSNR